MSRKENSIKACQFESRKKVTLDTLQYFYRVSISTEGTVSWTAGVSEKTSTSSLVQKIAVAVGFIIKVKNADRYISRLCSESSAQSRFVV